MTLSRDINALARRITPAERMVVERMASIATQNFVAHWFGGPTYMLPTKDAYAAWEAVWKRHYGSEPEPLGYELFCLGMCDRGNEVIRRHGTDWFARLQLRVPHLIAEITTGTPEVRDRLRAVADELYVARGAAA